MIAALWLGCGGAEPARPPSPAPVAAPQPAPAPSVPAVTFRLPDQVRATPRPIPLTPELARTRAVLEKVVVDHARDPDNPWAIVHGMLALGPEMKLANGADPVDWMFEHHAEVDPIAGEELIAFPASRGDTLIEPHTDLILKSLTEAGVRPDRAVTVAGRSFVVGQLYRSSLSRAWVADGRTGFQEGGFNDTPWSLQALAAWAPADLKWESDHHPMTVGGFTDAVVQQLVAETRDMVAAQDAGQLVQKDTRHGLFGYTCGGQHLLQGAAFAVGRGFGAAADRDVMCRQLALLRWRIDVELASIDPILTRPGVDPNIQLVLLSQRLKFLGHWLETTHKFGAFGVCPLGPEDEAASVRVANELVRTVAALDALGVWADVSAVQRNRALDPIRKNGARQVYLDLVGDSAHAVHGIDLATGAADVAL